MKKLKKRYWVLGLLFLLAFYMVEGRSFYRVGEGKWVTVWKQVNRTTIVTPYIYLGLTWPKDNYIKTNGGAILSIYWDEQKPGEIVVYANDGLKDIRGEIINNSPEKIIIHDFLESEEKKEEYIELFNIQGTNSDYAEDYISSFGMKIVNKKFTKQLARSAKK